MTFHIDAVDLGTSAKDVEKIVRARCRSLVRFVKDENSLEYKKLNDYFYKNYTETLFKLLNRTIDYITVNKDETGYLLTILNHSIEDRLTTEMFIGILMNGNLEIRKTDLVQKMIRYAFKYM